MNFALVQPSGNAATDGSMRECASFAARRRKLERKLALPAWYTGFIDHKWVSPDIRGHFDNISPCGASIRGWLSGRDALRMSSAAVEAIAVAETMCSASSKSSADTAPTPNKEVIR